MSADIVARGLASKAQSSIASGAVPFSRTASYAAGTVGRKLQEMVSVRDFGAVGDGIADDTAAIQAAITASLSINGGAVHFPNGVYRITAALNIPFATGWRISGQSRHGATIRQATDNTPIFNLTAALTHSWVIEELNLTWATAQPGTNTNAIAIKMGTGAPNGSGFFNFQVRRCTFGNGFRGIAGDATNSPALWGVRISDCVFGGTMTGAAFFAAPNPAVGQPNLCIENCLIDAAVATESVVRISSGDNVMLRSIEFLNGTAPVGLMAVSTSFPVTVVGCKSEGYVCGANTTALWDFPNSHVSIIGCSFNGFTGTSTPRLIQANSNGQLSVQGLHANSSLTAGQAIAYSASTITLAANVRLIGLVTDDVRAYLGNVALPRHNADNAMMDWLSTRGDANVTMTNADDRIQYFNTTLTAARTITLPVASTMRKGMEIEVVRRATTPGAFTLTVIDPASGNNHVFAASTNGYVRYRFIGGQYLIVAAGVF